MLTRGLGQKTCKRFLNLGLYLSLPALFPLLTIVSQTRERLCPQKGLNCVSVASWITVDIFLVLLMGLYSLTSHAYPCIHVTLAKCTHKLHTSYIQTTYIIHTERERESISHWKV